MTNEPILVTGAAGGLQGSTGNHVTRSLLKRGLPVRAFVRIDDERAESLRSIGAEVYVGDLREIASVQPALRGVRRAFFTYSVTDGLLDAAAVFAAAAAQEGVQQVVEVSQLGPEPQAGTPRLRQHWVAEQVFDHAAVGAVHLRATAFYENIRELIMGDAEGSKLLMPLGGEDTVLPLVSGEDVARVAVGILSNPEIQPAGFHRLIGQFLSVGEIVETFSRATGQPLHYVDVPSEAWKSAVLASGINSHAAEHLTRLWQLFRAADVAHSSDPVYELNDAIKRIGGQPAQPFEGFLRANAAIFTADSSR